MGKELDPGGFELLLQRLSAEDEVDPTAPRTVDVCRQRAGERYRLLWEKLSTYLERNGCVDHHHAADEVIQRVILAISEKEILNVQAYSYGVARLVKLEYLRKQQRFESLPDSPEELDARTRNHPAQASQAAAHEDVTTLMKDCFAELPSEEQALMTRYVNTERGEKQQLADEFGLPLHVIQQKVFKIRKRLREGLDFRLGRSARTAPAPPGTTAAHLPQTRLPRD